jgi:hypothetical protein
MLLTSLGICVFVCTDDGVGMLNVSLQGIELSPTFGTEKDPSVNSLSYARFLVLFTTLAIHA